MPQMTVHPPKLHNGQLKVWNSPERFQVLACGRRWGKTRLGSVRCLKTASDGGRAWWVAPSYPMAQVGWRLVRRLAAQLPGTTINQADRLVTLPNGGTIQVKSADNPDSLRGEGLDFLVLDECAFIKEDAWVEALRPALSDRKGHAMFISTPKGRNWFWHAWMRGNVGDDSEWRAWQFPTSSNPYIEAKEIAAARTMLPERIFQQEYLAEFIEDSGMVFRGVMAAATASAQNKAVAGHEYVLGVDWAKHSDFTVLAVLDATTNELVYLDRFNQIDYITQLGRLEGLYIRFQPSQIIAESNAMGEPLIEQLQRQGYPVQPFVTTNASKQQAIDALALAFEKQELKILPDPALIGELQAYESQRLPSGLLRYSAPEGMHDDTVVALALAWQGVARGHWFML